MMGETLRKLTDYFNERRYRERVLILGVMLVALACLWLVMLYDPMAERYSEQTQRIADIRVQTATQEARVEELEEMLQRDPDALARQRLARLDEELAAVDQRLRRLYGQFLSPRDMSELLVSILRSETGLQLISLENRRPEVVYSSAEDTEAADDESTDVEPVRIYRHGLVMEMEGSYLETLGYLRSIEELGSRFFWHGLSYEVDEHPRGRVVLSIYTLSSEEKWIGG